MTMGVDVDRLYSEGGLMYALLLCGIGHYASAFEDEGLCDVRAVEALDPERLQRLVRPVGERRRLLNVLAPGCPVSGSAVVPFVLNSSPRGGAAAAGATDRSFSVSPRGSGPGYDKYQSMTKVLRRPRNSRGGDAFGRSATHTVSRSRPISYFASGVRGTGTEYTTDVGGMARESARKARSMRLDLNAFGRTNTSESMLGSSRGQMSPRGSARKSKQKRSADKGRVYEHPMEGVDACPTMLPPPPARPPQRHRPAFVSRESVLEFLLSARVNIPAADATRLDRDLRVRGITTVSALCKAGADVLQKCQASDKTVAQVVDAL